MRQKKVCLYMVFAAIKMDKVNYITSFNNFV